MVIKSEAMAYQAQPEECFICHDDEKVNKVTLTLAINP